MFIRKPYQAETRYPVVEYEAPRQMIAALKRAVGQMQRDDIRTVQALLVRCAGDFAAGMVLYRLLEWMPFSKREDGGIWKSDKEWGAELGLTYAQMSRVRRRLKGVVRAEVRRAQGSPTYHYWLDAEELLRRVAEVYGITVLLARVMIWRKVENPNSTEVRMEVRESRESILEKVEKPEQVIQQEKQQEEPQKDVSIFCHEGDEIWQMTKAQLLVQVDRETGAHVRAAVGRLEGDVLVVRTRVPFVVERASRMVAKVASGIVGRKVSVRVEGNLTP